MSPSYRTLRGKVALQRLLHQRAVDLRHLDVPGFRDWLGHHLQRWRNDPVFVQRCLIRDLRREHPRLRALEAQLREAEAADRASVANEALSRLDRQLVDTAKAVAGLSAAVVEADAEQRSRFLHKLQRFRALHQALVEERDQLIRSSPERRALLRLQAELASYREKTGQAAAQSELERLQRDQGRGSSRSGGEFETLAHELTWRFIVPDLVEKHRLVDCSESIEVLRGVTLGAAATELDQVVVLRPERSWEPVRVLAVVEAKRNINDLGHGFRRRQDNLGWLTRDVAFYDAGSYRTRAFPTGHFDREVAHRQDGTTYVLAPASFADLHRDPTTGYIMHGLYFVTREGTLWGASAATLSRISHRVSTDLDWDPDDQVYLEGLMRWCGALTDPVEAPDVVAMYASRSELADQLLLVPRAAPSG